jgi:hypothetical protein
MNTWPAWPSRHSPPSNATNLHPYAGGGNNPRRPVIVPPDMPPLHFQKPPPRAIFLSRSRALPSAGANFRPKPPPSAILARTPMAPPQPPPPPATLRSVIWSINAILYVCRCVTPHCPAPLTQHSDLRGGETGVGFKTTSFIISRAFLSWKAGGESCEDPLRHRPNMKTRLLCAHLDIVRLSVCFRMLMHSRHTEDCFTYRIMLN